jgi:peptide/nickel transport system permease protein
MINVLGQQYIWTARAQGAPERRVVLRHALRNALPPSVVVIGLEFGSLLGGVIIVETVFSWPGVGSLLIDSINSRDFPVVQAIVLMLATIFIVINLAVDLINAALDPRVSTGWR